jgi:hypothetical protein
MKLQQQSMKILDQIQLRNTGVKITTPTDEERGAVPSPPSCAHPPLPRFEVPSWIYSTWRSSIQTLN